MSSLPTSPEEHGCAGVHLFSQQLSLGAHKPPVKKMTDSVVSTNKRSQAGVSKVYLALKYLEAVTTMYTLQSLYQVQPMSAGVALHSASTSQPKVLYK